MAYSISSPLTGMTQTGLTNPTYTLALDRAPDANTGVQYAVTALGGTQTGVTIHSVSSPFTLTLVRPKAFKTLGHVNPITGALPNVPKNQWVFIVRKGVVPLAGQSPSVLIARLTIDVPAGSDVADPLSIRAALSALTGALANTSNLLGDSLTTGLI